MNALADKKYTNKKCHTHSDIHFIMATSFNNHPYISSNKFSANWHATVTMSLHGLRYCKPIIELHLLHFWLHCTGRLHACEINSTIPFSVTQHARIPLTECYEWIARCSKLLSSQLNLKHEQKNTLVSNKPLPLATAYTTYLTNVPIGIYNSQEVLCLHCELWQIPFYLHLIYHCMWLPGKYCNTSLQPLKV